MLPHPCLLGGSQTKRDTIIIRCPTPAFSGPQKRAKLLPHAYIVGGLQTKRDKISIGCLTRAFPGAKK